MSMPDCLGSPSCVCEQPIGTLSYTFNFKLDASGVERTPTIKVNALDASCGVLSFQPPLTLSAQRGSVVGAGEGKLKPLHVDLSTYKDTRR
jgi:hypothetical protein